MSEFVFHGEHYFIGVSESIMFVAKYLMK